MVSREALLNSIISLFLMPIIFGIIGLLIYGVQKLIERIKNGRDQI